MADVGGGGTENVTLYDEQGAQVGTTTNPLLVKQINDAGVSPFVKSTDPAANDAGLVVRVAGEPTVVANIQQGGQPISDTNPLATRTWLFDESGAVYNDANRIPVDIGTVTVAASFDSIISTANSSITPLAANATFAGAWEEVTDYASISTLLKVDQVCTIKRQFSINGSTVDYEESAVAADGFVTPLSTPPLARYFRFQVVNGATAMGVFRLETTYHFTSPSEATGPLAVPANDLTTATSTRSFLFGRTPPTAQGALATWNALKASLDGVLSVAIDQIVKTRGENTSVTGTLTGAAATGAAQTLTGAGQTVVMIEVPEGHQSTQIRLYGTFSATSQVFFEGSADGTDNSWFSLNQRRNTNAEDNDETTLLDASPFGGPSPTGAGNSNWRGSPGGVKFFRVRCGAYTANDAINVKITTSTAGGPIFQQGPPPLPSDRFATGTFTAVNQSVSLATSGTGSFAALLTGQWTGKVLFEQTIDGTTWRATSAITAPGQTAQFITGLGTANQNSGGRGSSAGTRQVRLRTDTDFVGTVALSLRAGGGTFAVALTAPVQVGGLYQGSSTNRFAVGTTAVRLDAVPLTNRSTVEIKYHSNGAANNGYVYVGFTNSLSALNGRELSPGESWTLDVTSATALYAIASTTNQQVQFTELA